MTTHTTSHVTMQDITVLLEKKKLQLEELRKEIESLEIVIPLLDNKEDTCISATSAVANMKI